MSKKRFIISYDSMKTSAIDLFLKKDRKSRNEFINQLIDKRLIENKNTMISNFKEVSDYLNDNCDMTKSLYENN